MINEQLPRYLAVTAEQIQAVARDVFRADNRVVLTYVPQAPETEPASQAPEPEIEDEDEMPAEEAA
jgi:hypothetical protein